MFGCVFPIDYLVWGWDRRGRVGEDVCGGGFLSFGRLWTAGPSFQVSPHNQAEISASRKSRGNKRSGLSKQPRRVLLLSTLSLYFPCLWSWASKLSGFGLIANMSRYFKHGQKSLPAASVFCWISRTHSCSRSRIIPWPHFLCSSWSEVRRPVVFSPWPSFWGSEKCWWDSGWGGAGATGVSNNRMEQGIAHRLGKWEQRGAALWIMGTVKAQSAEVFTWLIISCFHLTSAHATVSFPALGNRHFCWLLLSTQLHTPWWLRVDNCSLKTPCSHKS